MTERETILSIVGKEEVAGVLEKLAAELRELPFKSPETYRLCPADVYNFAQELVDRGNELKAAQNSGQITKEERIFQIPKLLIDAAEKWLIRNYKDKHEVRTVVCKVLLGRPYIEYRAKYESEKFENE